MVVYACDSRFVTAGDLAQQFDVCFNAGDTLNTVLLGHDTPHTVECRSFRKALLGHMEFLRDQLTRLWSEDITFVFPSEISAAFWRKEAIRWSGRGAVREDRLISWDVFKERAFGLRGDRVPANRSIRAAFVESLLLENAEQPFLTTLVAPDFARISQSFADHVAGLLPVLPDFTRAVVRNGSPILGPHLCDARAVEKRYRGFLSKHGLFEPGWLEVDYSPDSHSYVLVLPELIEDEPRYRDVLKDATRLLAPVNSTAALQQFCDTRTELRWVLREIGNKLDGGTSPDAIVLTVAGLDKLADRIAHEAERYSVPLSFRSGTRLADTSVGRFLMTFKRVLSSGVGVASLKELLLNRCVPWIDYAANVDLVLQGVRLGCLGGRPETDLRWRGLRGDAPRKRFAAIVQTVRDITGAVHFGELRAALFAFLSQFVDPNGWGDSDQRVLQRCLKLIGELTSMDKDLGITVNDPLGFWLDRLADQLYVERHRSEGVPVFAYRVAAGMLPDYHYVINASQRATAYQVSRFPFLADHQRQELDKDGGERDLSSLFLRAYACSGKSVTFSMAQSTHEGPALPASWFVTGRSVLPVDEDEAKELAQWDSYRSEQRDEQVDRPHQLQLTGASEYAHTESRAGSDYTRTTVSDPVVRGLVTDPQRSEERPELLRFSVGDVDAFRRCPFSYLLSRGLRLEELEYEIDPDSNRDIGTLYHRIFQIFFDGLSDRGEQFRGNLVGEYTDVLRTIAENEFAHNRGMTIDLVLASYRDRFDRIISAVLDHDSSLVEGHQPVSVEGWQRLVLPDQGLLLVGRFDRITRAPDGTLTLVDYKKRSIPRARDINGGSASPIGWEELSPEEKESQRARISAIQMPFYVKLIEGLTEDLTEGLTEGAGERVARAVYYSLEEGEQHIVFSDVTGDDSPIMTRHRLDEIITVIDEITVAIRDRVIAGDYRCPLTCDGCGFRSVCRTRYVVR